MSEYLRDALIGRTADGTRVYVSAAVTHHDRVAQTITHESVDGYDELTMSGLLVDKGRTNAGSAGQCLDALRDIVTPAAPFTLGDARTLHALWSRWHLDALRAGCAHMVLPEDTSYDARKDITCPESGYRYGSAWLVEPLPADHTGTIDGDPEAVLRFIAGRTPSPQTYRGE